MHPCGTRRLSCEPSFKSLDIFDAATKRHWFASDAHGSSILKLQVYAQRAFGRDDFIGGMEDNIESLLSQENSGGNQNPQYYSSQS